MNYNLLNEKWLPVLYENGKVDRVNILDAFAQASRIREIAASNPMDRIAVLRFLLALLYWCRGNPPDGLPCDLFPSNWFDKALRNRERFDLLGESTRFYQRRGAGDKKLAANYLIHEAPTGTNFWHFRHTADKSDGLCPACCAVGLLRLPVFATSGGKGKSPGINSKPPIYVIPLGTSLEETLRFSWREVPNSDLGTPGWEKPDLTLPKHGRVPLLTGLTWLPRRVWLDDPGAPRANCISCGRNGALIRRCVFAGIGSAKTDDSGDARAWIDPHTVGDGNNVLKPSSALASADAAAGQWAATAAAILGTEKPNKENKKFWVVGFATVQNDKYLEAVDYEIPAVEIPDDRSARDGVEKIERWQREGWKLAAKAKPRGENRSVRHLEILPAVAAVRPNAEARVSSHVGEILAVGGDAWDQAAQEYAPMMKAVSHSLSPGYTTAALRRRREIANVRPEMRPKATAARKGGPNNGGGK